MLKVPLGAAKQSVSYIEIKLLVYLKIPGFFYCDKDTMNAPSVDVVFSADWNIFGYDPNGLLAYLVAYFFGPDWLPETFDHLPRWLEELEVKPPRYGPPGPQQAKFLPPGWKCSPPPLYYGECSGPYLPPPRFFHPSAFASLVHPHPRVPPVVWKEKPMEAKGEKSSNRLEPLNLMSSSFPHYYQMFSSREAVIFQSAK